MDESIWEFEGDWYVRLPDGRSFCMNSREAAEDFASGDEQILERLDRIITLLTEIAYPSNIHYVPGYPGEVPLKPEYGHEYKFSFPETTGGQ